MSDLGKSRMVLVVPPWQELRIAYGRRNPAGVAELLKVRSAKQECRLRSVRRAAVRGRRAAEQRHWRGAPRNWRGAPRTRVRAGGRPARLRAGHDRWPAFRGGTRQGRGACLRPRGEFRRRPPGRTGFGHPLVPGRGGIRAVRRPGRGPGLDAGRRPAAVPAGRAGGEPRHDGYRHPAGDAAGAGPSSGVGTSAASARCRPTAGQPPDRPWRDGGAQCAGPRSRRSVARLPE